MSDASHGEKKGPPWNYLWFAFLGFILFFIIAGMYSAQKQEVDEFWAFILRGIVIGFIGAMVGVGIKLALNGKGGGHPPAKKKEEPKADEAKKAEAPH